MFSAPHNQTPHRTRDRETVMNFWIEMQQKGARGSYGVPDVHITRVPLPLGGDTKPRNADVKPTTSVFSY